MMQFCFKKIVEKGPKTGSRQTVPFMGKSGFFIDFQKFLKIDLEIIRTEEQMKPAPLLFDETSEKTSRARLGAKSDFHDFLETCFHSSQTSGLT